MLCILLINFVVLGCRFVQWAFNVFKAHRESLLSAPKVTKDLEGIFKCILHFGARAMSKEGRGYGTRPLNQRTLKMTGSAGASVM